VTPRRARDRGSATVLTVAALGVLVVLLGAGLALVGVVRDVHRARAAADLAALAAAAPLLRGLGIDCAAAREVAAANGGVLRGCRTLADGSVETWVARPRSGAGWWGRGLPEPSARARAGVVGQT
jgi:secretion/DNA translocation related TadE-like protein